MRLTGRQIRYDGVNYKPETESCEQAKAARWTSRGGPADLEKARAHAATIDAMRVAVYAYPTTERRAMAIARAAILAAK